MANVPPPPQRPNQPNPEIVRGVENILTAIGGALQKAQQERAARAQNEPRTSQKQDRTALYWFLGVIPILFACLQLMIVAHGDTETLRSLVQTLNVTALALGTLLPLACAVITLISILAFLRIFTNGPKPRTRQRVVNALIGITLVLLIDFYAMPILHFVIIGAIFLAIVVLAILLAIAFAVFRLPVESRQKLVQGSAIGFAVILLFAPLFIMIGFLGVWMPQERISMSSTKIEPAYVLSSDGEWTKYMDGEHKVHIVRTKEITRRVVVDVPRSTWQKTPNELLHQWLSSNRTPTKPTSPTPGQSPAPAPTPTR